ncbi:protein translocase subunit SecF [Paucibacter aquatile]|jgi:preprotein translocase subunit SecF|uniref:Protein-export membrane protein SecF n=1 Tax=Kinneretia aquatilis TaxID=2070761 RepID=A0A2N8KY23_9BURK|nr:MULTISPECIES: protein translocase subunit SecF [Roseateles]PND38379.1 protein translocase subunit SecF [Paucibacter aquatile]WIV97359.1 protein translocase subunit SecF [Paucibacter aquatile]
MELFRIKRDLPLMKHALIFNVISFLTFAAAVFFLVTRSLNFSIEFTGGTVMEIEYAKTAEIDKTRHVVEQMNFGEVTVQPFGSSHDVMLRLPLRGDIKQTEQVGRVFAELCKAESGSISQRQTVSDKGEAISKQVCLTPDGAEPVKLSRSEVVGPAVGEELAHDAGLALGMTVIGIMIYLAFRFEWKFAVAGIIANLHDVVIILGFFAYFQWEFSLAVLAAILAVLGYSVNESVVIFDRVREAFRKYRKLNTHEVIDHAITSTMSRTIITHGSTQLMVLSMLIFGGPTLHYFAVALTIGILFGIYSSVFVAAAIAMWLGVKREDLVKTPINKEDPDDPNAGAVV